MTALARGTVGAARGSGIPLLDMLETWFERRHQRRQLAELPDVLLKDVGLSAADVERETSKPMWRG